MELRKKMHRTTTEMLKGRDTQERDSTEGERGTELRKKMLRTTTEMLNGRETKEREARS